MRNLFKLAALALIAVGITKLVAVKKEWTGLTEAEARSKLDAKMADKVGEEAKRAEISDKVIEGMRKKGLLVASETTEGTAAATTMGEGEATA